jgi:hypothetical protein
LLLVAVAAVGITLMAVVTGKVAEAVLAAI